MPPRSCDLRRGGASREPAPRAPRAPRRSAPRRRSRPRTAPPCRSDRRPSISNNSSCMVENVVSAPQKPVPISARARLAGERCVAIHPNSRLPATLTPNVTHGQRPAMRRRQLEQPGACQRARAATGEDREQEPHLEEHAAASISAGGRSADREPHRRAAARRPATPHATAMALGDPRRDRQARASPPKASRPLSRPKIAKAWSGSSPSSPMPSSRTA